MTIEAPDPDKVYKSSRLRLTALDHAIVYHQIREGAPEDVVETADLFFRFLEGDTQ